MAVTAVNDFFTSINGRPVIFDVSLNDTGECCGPDSFDFNTSSITNNFYFDIESGHSLTGGVVDWGDGNTAPLATGLNTHSYLGAGSRQVFVSGIQVDGNDCNETVKNLVFTTRITAINLLNLPSLETFSNEGSDLTSLNLSGNPNISTVQVVENQISGPINIVGVPRLLAMILLDNNFSVSDVNNILVNFDNTTISGNIGWGIDITANSIPSGAGLTAKTNILAKNLFCNTD